MEKTQKRSREDDIVAAPRKRRMKVKVLESEHVVPVLESARVRELISEVSKRTGENVVALSHEGAVLYEDDALGDVLDFEDAYTRLDARVDTQLEPAALQDVPTSTTLPTTPALPAAEIELNTNNPTNVAAASADLQSGTNHSSMSGLDDRLGASGPAGGAEQDVDGGFTICIRFPNSHTVNLGQVARDTPLLALKTHLLSRLQQEGELQPELAGITQPVLLFVRYQGDICTLSVKAMWVLVSSLKHQITAKLGLPEEQQTLFFCSRVLDDASTLQAAGIQPSSTICLHTPAAAGGPPNIGTGGDEGQGVDASKDASEEADEGAAIGAAGNNVDDDAQRNTTGNNVDDDDRRNTSCLDVRAMGIDVDLWTSTRPLCSTPASTHEPLSKWLDPTPGTVQLYANLRPAGALEQGGVSTHQRRHFDLCPAWHACLPSELGAHPPPQSPAGLGHFLASLCVLCAHLSKDEPRAREVLGFLLRLVPFPPAALALWQLVKGQEAADANKGALAATCLCFLRRLCPPTVPPAQVFQHSSVAFGFLCLRASPETALPPSAIEHVTLACPLTQTRLRDPVQLRLPHGLSAHSYSAANARLRIRGGAMCLPGSPFAGLDAADLEPDPHAARLLLAFSGLEAWGYAAGAAEAAVSSTELSDCTAPLVTEGWDTLGRRARREVPALSEVPPLALKRAQVPALTIGADRLARVFYGPQACSVDQVSLYNPVSAQDTAHNPDELARALGLDSVQAAVVDDRAPREAIMVLLDASGSMDEHFDSGGLTRMEVVKQLFFAFVNRSMAYDYPCHIGLIVFSTRASVRCPISPIYEEFRRHVDEAEVHGRTALFDALYLGVQELNTWRLRAQPVDGKLPRVRMLVLSDGLDNYSHHQPHDVCQLIQQSGVVVDALCIGEAQENATLRGICHASGALAFAPPTLNDALRCVELETLLCSWERPDRSPQAMVQQPGDLYLFEDERAFPWQPCSSDDVPARRADPMLFKPVTSVQDVLLGKEVEAVAAATAAAGANAGGAAGASGGEARSAGGNQSDEVARARRLVQELRKCSKFYDLPVDIYPVEADISHWKIVMAGAPGTPYGRGTWLLHCQFPESFPRHPPELRFVTPIRHCNVNQYGKICTSVLGRDWTADTSIVTVLQAVYGLMLTPEATDPLDTALALLFFEATGEYEAQILEHTSRHASAKSRDEWKQQMLTDGKQMGGTRDDPICL
ncbi:hypothetical protein CYMTET_27504 [Cymbomonas tetramitiformis]|uniref:Uncharacterized protein n=1 Tax=Cymbomonas tetramitiformis TaxID=36881 RepID=A0AAE0FPY6_9CHLO|nr:hypothetical protein CYMTET_27504 [Cymbomonas tetramitiformis]